MNVNHRVALAGGRDFTQRSGPAEETRPYVGDGRVRVGRRPARPVSPVCAHSSTEHDARSAPPPHILTLRVVFPLISL